MESNPYQSPIEPVAGGQAPVALRPASVMVFGILNLVLGALGICGNAFGAIALFVKFPAQGPNPMLELMQTSTAYRAMTIVLLGLGLIGTIMLIISGVGLLKFKPYGRSLAVVYGFYTIATVIIGTVVNTFVVTMPMWAKLESMPPGPEKAGLIAGLVSGVVGSCFGFIYPCLLLFFMTRKNVVDALRADGAK